MSDPSAMQAILVDPSGRLYYKAQSGVSCRVFAHRPIFNHPVNLSAPLGSFENPHPRLPSYLQGNGRTARNQVAKGSSSTSEPKNRKNTETVPMQQQPPSEVQQAAWNGPISSTQLRHVPSISVHHHPTSPPGIQVNWGPRSDSPGPDESDPLWPESVQEQTRRAQFADVTATSHPYQEFHNPTSLHSFIPRSLRAHHHLAPSPPQSANPGSLSSSIATEPESYESACTICDETAVAVRDGPVRYCGPCLDEAKSAEDQHYIKKTQRRSLMEEEETRARRWRDAVNREAQIQDTEGRHARREAEMDTRRRNIERGVRTVWMETVREEPPLMRGAVDRQMRDFEMERIASQRRMGPNGVIYRDV